MRSVVVSLIPPVMAVVLVLTWAASALPAEPPMPYTLPNGIVVTDNIPIGKLPANVAKMTQFEFIVWAKQYNQQQVAAADKRHQNYRSNPRTARITEGTNTFSTKFGDSPYLNATDFYNNGDTSIHSEGSYSRKSYSVTYPDFNDHGGGPIEIINPFCWEFWRNHTEAD